MTPMKTISLRRVVAPNLNTTLCTWPAQLTLTADFDTFACIVSLKYVTNTSRTALKKVEIPGSPLPAPPLAGAGSDDPGDLQLLGTARLVFAVLLRERIVSTTSGTGDT